MDDLIKQIGSKFRGIWVAKPITLNGEILPHEWYVTFVFRNDMQDVGPCKTSESALKSAIEVLKNE